MLGEGFDHPPLSVAAIFRPFRALSPYVQFAGRVMRVISQNKPLSPENRGAVVTHVGLNTDRHWGQFKQLDSHDQSLLAGLLCGKPVPTRSANTCEQTNPIHDELASSFVPEMLVEWEMLNEDSAAISPFATDPVTSREPTAIETSSDEDANIKAVSRVVRKIAGPQQRRRESRSRLTSEVNTSISRTLTKSNLFGNGRQVARMFPRFRHLDNWASLRFWFYGELGKRVGRGQRKSENWSLAQIEQAIELLPELSSEIEFLILQKSPVSKRRRSPRCQPYDEY